MNRFFGGSKDCNTNYNRGKSFRFSEWNNSTLFLNDNYIQDFVSYMGSMYACIQNNTGIEPTNELYWKLVISGQPGKQGIQGKTGITFTPHVDTQGNLSWTNDGGLDNPETVNIKGQKGDKGADSTVPGPKGDSITGPTGPQGKKGDQGIGLEFNWDGTKLGIKRENEEEYTYVDLRGTQGSRGLRGIQGIQGEQGIQGPKGDSLYIQVSEPNEFGQRFLQKRYNENEAWVSFFDLSGMKGDKGDSIIIERNVNTGNIEYRYQGQDSSANKILIYKDDIKGPKGDTIAKTYVADDGYLYIQLSGEDLPRRVGYVRGDRGEDGREIVLRVYSGPSEDPDDPRIGTHLQWKYAGDEYKLWTNLIQINDLMNIALAGLKLEYEVIEEPNELGVLTKYEVINLSHYQVEFDENNNLVLTEKIANLSSVKVPTKILLKDVRYDYDKNKLDFVFDTATGEEVITIDCNLFFQAGDGIKITCGNIINVNLAEDSEKLADGSSILTVDTNGLRIRGIKDKLFKEINLIKNDRSNNTHYYSYDYIAQDGTVYNIDIPDFVEWTDNTDNSRQIVFRNEDKLVSYDADKVIRNLIKLDFNNYTQVGDINTSINLQGKDTNPYYNEEQLALISNLAGEISGLHLNKIEVPESSDIAARYQLMDKDNNILGNTFIDILKDNYLKEVTYNEDTYTFTFDFWVNDDPEEPAHDKYVTFTLQKLFDNLKAIIDEVDERLSGNISNLQEALTEETSNRESADALLKTQINEETNRALTAEEALRTDLDEEITRAKNAETSLSGTISSVSSEVTELEENLNSEISRATNAEKSLDSKLTSVKQELLSNINTKEDKFTVGTGLEMTSDKVLNVTLDVTVFKAVNELPSQPEAGNEQKIYLVPSDSGEANNIYNEYVWVNNAWELLGEYQSEVDLTPYLTKTEAQSKYQLIGDYVTNTELEEALAGVTVNLPIASDSVLGGIKVGAGLAINPDTGVLSATGGGTADSIDWSGVQSKPQINGVTLKGGNNTAEELDLTRAPYIIGCLDELVDAATAQIINLIGSYEELYNAISYKTPIFMDASFNNSTNPTSRISVSSYINSENQITLMYLRDFTLYKLTISKNSTELTLSKDTLYVTDELSGSNINPVQGNIIYEALQQKQNTLVSGTNIKTINNESILGSGNIDISTGIDDVTDEKTYARTQNTWIDLTDYLEWGEYE